METGYADYATHSIIDGMHTEHEVHTFGIPNKVSVNMIQNGYNPSCVTDGISDGQKGHTVGIPESTIGNDSRRSSSMGSDTLSEIDEIDYLFTQDLPALSSTVARAPALYIKSMPGKGMRDKLADALNIWLQVDPEDLAHIKHIISLLHNASLILDDVEDGSASRRGKPAAHMVFGVPQAVNSAGHQINKAMQEIMKLGDGSCFEIFGDEMDKLYIGQSHDLFWTFNTKCPTTEEYINMIDHKTGALFNMLARLMAAKSHVTSPSAPDLKRLVALLGRSFQIRDDYMNLTSLEYINQKGFCDDLDEGKYSLPLIHALGNAPEAEFSILQHLLQQRHVANEMTLAQKHLVLDTLKSTGSLEYTVTVLGKLFQDINSQIDKIEMVCGKQNKGLRSLCALLKV